VSEYKSALVRAKEAQPRPVTFVEIQGFVGLGGDQIHKVGIRTNLIEEQDRALVAAHKYVQDVAAGVEAAKEDADILQNSKTIHALYEAFREARTVDGKDELVCAVDGTPYPAFASPEWMRRRFTADQIATLLNLYNGVKFRESNAARADTDESVEDALMRIADAADTPFPEVVLAASPREILEKLVVVAAVKLRRARTELVTVEMERDEALAKVEPSPAAPEELAAP